MFDQNVTNDDRNGSFIYILQKPKKFMAFLVSLISFANFAFWFSSTFTVS